MSSAREPDGPTARTRPAVVARAAGPVPAETTAAAGRSLLQLQGVAGNAAVSALLAGRAGARTVQRLARGGGVPPPPVAPGPVVPTEHPGLRATGAKIAAARRQVTRHPTARSKAAEAGRAARAPADDKEAQAKAAKAGEMGAAPVGGFDKAAFIAAVSAAIAKAAPTNLEEADSFATSGKSDAVAAEVKGRVGQSKDASAKPVTEASAKPPDTSKARDKPVTALPPPATPGAVPVLDAKAAIPGRAPAEQTELGHEPAQTDQKMAEARVTEEQLATSNEPEFAGALAAKKEGEQHSATAPAALRTIEGQHLAGAQQGAQAAGVQGAASMLTARGAALKQVGGAQQKTQGRDESARATVTTRVKAIFDAAKSEVDAILAGIDPQVDQQFTAGEAQAKAAFTAHHQASMRAYKRERYSGALGGARWLKDLVADLPAEVNRFYVEAKQIYETRMRAVISGIADTVGRELIRAKDRISRGRAEISTYVGGLEPSLRSVGKEAASEIGSQLESLTASVEEKSASLAEDLAGRYVAARTAVDEEITKLQEENKGLWSKAKDAIGGAIETILKLKDMLLGVLARAAGAVSKIIRDPIGFLGNFVLAVKSGVMNFGGNILTHLKKGLQSWLFGTLADAGIEIPERFDLRGIVGMILSMLGLTWASIRARLAKVLPEWVLKALEGAVEVVKILSTQGVSGLWTWIVAKIVDLKEQVMGQIKDFVITKIITAGITWLISLLNPAAAFIKACKMIYDAVMWFVDNAERMSDFVNSVLDSVESIASGGVGKVAGMIEATLGKAIPMVISGLASLLGLGGIADKIKKILESIQKPVGRVVDGIIGGVVKHGKKLLGKLRKKGGRDETPEQKQKRLDAGLSAAQQAVNRLPGKAIKSQLARPILGLIKLKYKMTRLDLVVVDAAWVIRGAVNPEGDRPTTKTEAKVDPAKVKAAIAAAKTELSRARVEYNKRKAAEPDLTVACGSGETRVQGGGSLSDAQKDPAAARRYLEADAARWAGSKEFTARHLGQMLTLTPAASAKLKRLRKQESIDALLTTMGSYQYPGRRKKDREAYQAATGQYLPRRSFKDRGGPGSTSLVHAEKLLRFAVGATAIGVSRDQCGDCQSWFRAQAKGDAFLVVADPTAVRVYVNGEIKSPKDFI